VYRGRRVRWSGGEGMSWGRSSDKLWCHPAEGGNVQARYRPSPHHRTGKAAELTHRRHSCNTQSPTTHVEFYRRGLFHSTELKLFFVSPFCLVDIMGILNQTNNTTIP
jgi:hypothetical protein